MPKIILEKINELNPNDDKAFYNKALVAYETKEYEKAINDLREALKIKFDVADYHYLLGTILEAQGDSKNAIYAFEKFLEYSTDETLKERIKLKTKSLYDGVIK